MPVAIAYHEHGGQTRLRLRLIDGNRPEANDVLLVSQLWISGPLYTRRPDLVGFVNGLPLLNVNRSWRADRDRCRCASATHPDA